MATAQSQPKPKRLSAKQLIAILHGWTGAVASLFIFLIAATGLGLAFIGEMFEFVHGDAVLAEEGEHRHIAEIVEAAAQGHANGLVPFFIYMPDTQVEDMEVTMVYGPETIEGGSPGIMTLVDPVTATYKGNFDLYSDFAFNFKEFHNSLLLGFWGEVFMSVIGILLVLFVLTGLYMWWPRKGMSFRKKFFDVRTKGQLLAKLFNWHGLAGIWLGALTLLFAVTGVGLNKPEWFGPAMGQVDFLAPPPSWNQSLANNCGDTVTFREAADQALAAFPDRAISRAIIWQGHKTSYEFSLRGPDDWNSRLGDAYAEVHAQCAGTMRTTTLAQEPASQVFGYVIRSVHGGQVFGRFAEVSVIFTALALMLLSGSGVYLFLKKTLPARRTRKQQAKNRLAKEAAAPASE